MVGGLVAGAGALVTGGTLLAARWRRPPAIVGVPILRYRLVGRPVPGSPINDLRLPVSLFEAHAQHLRRRGFVPVTLAEALRRRKERAFLEGNPVVLTFDGPYASFASVVWPILCHYRLNRVTLFYPPAYLGHEQLVFPEGRPEPLLSTGDLRRLLAEGVSLGVQAPAARGQELPGLLAELRAGRQALADFSGSTPDTVAYSFSSVPAVQAAREAGFLGAAVLGEGVMSPGESPYAVPRFAVQPDTEPVQLAMVLARRVGGEY
ncbi:MAG: hypothetical protein D6731_08410 [Planctomycetota bacterium]|nr:MAG: hypothetical protein D6731_08410 [Planctomycetota bacterium]